MLIVTSTRNKERILRRTPQIKVGNEIIKPSPVVRNLGAYFDSTMCMVPHVNNCIKNIYYHLRRISGIRRHLNNDTCAKIVHAFVTSRLDFNNALLIGLPHRTLYRIQIVQNSAARLLSQTKKYDHITPVLHKLHWLPVHQRIKFKILYIIHKAIFSDDAPIYLQSLVTLHKPTTLLRSSNAISKFLIHRHNNSYG